jgi:tetratricopeptide (TPR) repeat protein
LLANTGHVPEAEQKYQEALALFQRLVADNPKLPDGHHELAATLSSLARLLQDGKKDVAGARRLLEEALPHHQAAFQANPSRFEYRLLYSQSLQRLAAVLLRLGEHSLAAAQAEALTQVTPDAAHDLYNSACYLSRCLPLAEKDEQLPEARRRQLAGEYGDRAMSLLRQAVEKGYRDVAQMKKDSDLDPLRARDDFRSFLASLEAKAGGR